MFSNVKQFGHDVFNWMDTFGHDHWGFILMFVFIWWLANRLLFGVWENILFYRRGYDWMRMRSQMRMPHFERARPNIGSTGFGYNKTTRHFFHPLQQFPKFTNIRCALRELILRSNLKVLITFISYVGKKQKQRNSG